MCLEIVSIDQNSHSLWDALPKCQALAAAGGRLIHYVEDIDVAFTSLGAGDGRLGLARERFHHSGGADWGAALFYSEFLGRLPSEPRDWEGQTGLKTAALARQLGRDVADLFEEFSPSDNWQLIGPSYAGDRDHHRIIGDISLTEAAPFVREILQIARRDCLRAFPEPASRRRVREWLDVEEARVGDLLERLAGGRLVDLYRAWMGEHLGGRVRLDFASNLFAVAGGGVGGPMLKTFLTDYDQAAGLYNQAIAETASRLRPLETHRGELPFFAVLDRGGRLVRTPVFRRGGQIVIDETAFRLGPEGTVATAGLSAAGVRCLAGKAVVLVIQVRQGPTGRALALPYRGSAYTATADRLVEKLSAAGLLAGPLRPIVRVRFGLLDRLRSVETRIHLPPHLARAFGRDEVPASRLGREHAEIARAAAERLEKMKDPAWRERWQAEAFAPLARQIETLERRRRELAETGAAPPEIRPLWKRIKALRAEVLDGALRRIADDVQLRDLDYWDSRGALLPWSIALGGAAFYNALVREARVYEEAAP